MKKINLGFLHSLPKRVIIEAINKTFHMDQYTIEKLYRKSNEIIINDLIKKQERLREKAKMHLDKANSKRHDELAKLCNETKDTKKKLAYLKEMQECFFDPLELYKQCNQEIDDLFQKEQEIWKKLR